MTTALQVPTTATEFGAIFSRLARQLRWHDFTPADTTVFFETLNDLPLAIVHESAKRIANEPGRKYFPTTGEWREHALEYEQELRRKLASDKREWVTECLECDDTGWQFYECTGDNFCGRQQKHLAHRFVRICPCRETNRTYQRHLAQSVNFAAKKNKPGRSE